MTFSLVLMIFKDTSNFSREISQGDKTKRQLWKIIESQMKISKILDKLIKCSIIIRLNFSFT